MSDASISETGHDSQSYRRGYHCSAYDGRTISVPLTWYPRLVYATQEERDNWEIFGDGRFIHWPDLDEDLSIEGLLAGWPSRESPKSFRRWLEAKRAGLPVTIHEIRPASTEEV